MKLLIPVMSLACATAGVAAESPPHQAPAYRPRYAFKPAVEDYFRAASRKLKEQGTTKINLCYDPEGRPTQSKVVESSGFARLDEAAVRWGEAVRISPGLIFGWPQQDCVDISVMFSLDKSREPPDQGEDGLVPARPPLPAMVLPPAPVAWPPPPPRRLSPPPRIIPLGSETA
jgi:TonB family protein